MKNQKNGRSGRFKRIKSWFFVAITLFSAVNLAVFSNPNSVAAASYGDNIHTAAQAALVTKFFLKCYDQTYTGLTSSGTTYGSNTGVSTGISIFYAQYGVTGVNDSISVGAWLEKQIGGKVVDGDVWCGEGNNYSSSRGSKIVQLFAKYMLDSEDTKTIHEQLFCNKSNSSIYGITRPINKNGNKATYYNGGCNDEWSESIQHI